MFFPPPRVSAARLTLEFDVLPGVDVHRPRDDVARAEVRRRVLKRNVEATQLARHPDAVTAVAAAVVAGCCLCVLTSTSHHLSAQSAKTQVNFVAQEH